MSSCIVVRIERSRRAPFLRTVYLAAAEPEPRWSPLRREALTFRAGNAVDALARAVDGMPAICVLRARRARRPRSTA